MMIDAETIEYGIKQVALAILFVAFIGFLLTYAYWFMDLLDEGPRPRAHSDNDADTSDDVQG